MTTLLLWSILIGSEPRPVVILTDVGGAHDDPWAVAHLLLARDRFNVRAVVTSHSPDIPAPIAASAEKVVRELLEALPSDPERPAIVAGAVEPLANLKTPRTSLGAKTLRIEAGRGSPESRLIVVLLGPATDLALAIEAEPAIVERIEVVAMGFDGWPKGGDGYNVKHDVDAWRIVMESHVPLTIVDVETTARDLKLTRKALTERFSKAGTLGKILARGSLGLLDRDSKLAEKLSGEADAAVVWDEGTTAVLLGYAKVETRVRPKLRPDATFEPGRSGATLRWATGYDSTKLWDDLERRLRGIAGGVRMP